MIYIGKTIKKFRIARGQSQQNLAVKANLSVSFLSLLENDRRRPSLLVIRRLAEALDISEEALIWDAVELPPDLDEKDRRLCELARIIVGRIYETTDAHRNAPQS